MTGTRHLRPLDGVRGIAIGCVMALHFAGDYFPGGAVGVDVFFALSAYLITTLLLNERRATGQVSFRDFYARRALRLGPALILWLALLAWPTSLAIHQGRYIWGSTVASLLYFGNYAVNYDFVRIGDAYTHIWSLAIEEQFYLIWPALLILVLSRLGRALRLVMLAAWVVAIAGTVAVQSSYFLPWGHAVPIVGGAAVAVLGASGMPHRLEQTARWWPLAGLCTVAIAVVTLAGDDRLALLAGSIAAVLLVAHCAAASSPVTVLLGWEPIVWLGQRSYGLYLYHRTIAILLPALIPSLTLKTALPLDIVASCVAAELSYRLVEAPIMRWGRSRLNRRSNSMVDVELTELSR